VLYAQIMCSNCMECLVNFWNRLIFAYLAQDCHLSLQTSVIGSRGMGKAFVHWQGCICLVLYLVLILMFNTLNPISMCWSQMVSNAIVHFCFQNGEKLFSVYSIDTFSQHTGQVCPTIFVVWTPSAKFGLYAGSMKFSAQNVERLCVCVCVCSRARVGGVIYGKCNSQFRIECLYF
jgi:hypothetical protein